MPKKRKLHLSASSIAAFKRCATWFRNAYVLGIRVIEDDEKRRVGTNWHLLLDLTSREPSCVCPECGHKSDPDPDCWLCKGTDFMSDDPMVTAVRVLDNIYTGKDFADPLKMRVERAKLLYMLYGYRWYYGMGDPDTKQVEVITREQRFELSLINPESGRALPGVKLVGMIDKIIRDGLLAVEEHKTTSSSVDTDSDYWGHLNLDTQTSLYLYAARRMQLAGDLTPWGIKETDPLISEIKYDVMHKPTIKPKKLTQGDSKKFVEDGVYFGQTFEVGEIQHVGPPGSGPDGIKPAIKVDGELTEVEPGKKKGSFQIRETPEMYGARLLADIGERPEFYFRKVTLTRTDKEMNAFEWKLLHIYRNMQSMIKTGYWTDNEFQCEATFKCDYISQCYNGIELAEGDVPEGMTCIFDKKEEA